MFCKKGFLEISQNSQENTSVKDPGPGPASVNSSSIVRDFKHIICSLHIVVIRSINSIHGYLLYIVTRYSVF